MKSRMERAQQRDAGARQVELGVIQDPLRLPFARILQEARHVGLPEFYRRFVQASAAALSLGQREDVYLDAIRGLERSDLDVLVRAFHQLVLDMDDRPYMDLLGPLYMEIGHRFDRSGGGEFFTPHSVSVLLARLGFDRSVFRPGEILECNEPTCGTGGMVLAATEVLVQEGIDPRHARWVVQDISARSCHGAYVNLTLHGIPAVVICGDTLRMEERWRWANPFWGMARPWPTEQELDEQARDAIQAEWRITAMRKFLAGLGAA